MKKLIFIFALTLIGFTSCDDGSKSLLERNDNLIEESDSIKQEHNRLNYDLQSLRQVHHQLTQQLPAQ